MRVFSEKGFLSPLANFLFMNVLFKDTRPHFYQICTLLYMISTTKTICTDIKTKLIMPRILQPRRFLVTILCKSFIRVHTDKTMPQGEPGLIKG
ncbi:hypothetical protein BW716_27150 [[Flexibacter] sp. ATCC 35208]|nr:hypothetical protein BW716_27150 [[Flexibacter] sp. ATCC 35208]